ncbi:DoxX family membrane protein [Streptomyces marincola]|uniref:DoxX family membrane protein n=1 Tax=Streptomyces marincola TaxID=2878388 RepID=UPI001CF412C1|nr:DoxX family membrane protein [Streptomyces marincola]UCM88769.1 DoxX family membrane protein [Streptomyces marincola]
MSVDTRTPRGLSADEPVLSMVKVPCDPAQVVVNHASFRVRLATPPPVSITVPHTGPLPRVPAAARRRPPVVWTGRSAPGDTGAGTLIRAAREAGHGRAGEGAATQVLPRVARAPQLAGVVGPRSPQPPEQTRVLPRVSARPGGPEEDRQQRRPAPANRAAARTVGRQAYHSGRNLSLGVVLLPLRLLLGFMSIYAGMGKLTDPVYFDGGVRGSLYAWLSALQPWTVAAPLHDWALSHPVGAGLTVAFIQIIVGVLTIFGLWQRVAAGLGALLSLALLVTVSWRQGPAFDTPDIVLCAAWSPLLIAGAPVYSLDARLAGEAWRRLGPRAPLADLRHRVLRRGAALATLLIGTSLLIGSMLGSAVRSDQFPTLPEPGEPPRNHLPGRPLPGEEAEEEDKGAGREDEGEAGANEGRAAEDEDEPGAAEDEAGSAPGAADEGPAGGAATGGATQESFPRSEQTVPAPQQPSAPDSYTPQESPAAPPTGSAPGDAGEAPESTAPSDDGGEQGSLDPIGGLLG